MTKILLIGDFSVNLDEGYKNVCHHLARWLEFDGQEVTRINNKQIITKKFFDTIIKTKPEIVHIITQPTDISFLFAYFLRLYYQSPPLIISALKPESYIKNYKLSVKQRMFLYMSRPDLILLQNDKVAEIINNIGYKTVYIPNGIDLNKFTPVNSEQKNFLRRKYKLEVNRLLVLSVGHLESARNLQTLECLVHENIQVVIAGSIYLGIYIPLIEELEKAGIIIFKGYQPNIEEFYQMADCYVFPVPPGNSLSMPLSVLEAMACNLPVVTTRFTGLQKYIKEGIGYRYMDQASQLVDLVHEVLSLDNALNTRDMVKRFSWQSIVHEIENHYSSLLYGRPCD